MFYAQFVLSKKGPLAKIWLAAHWEKKLTKAQVFETNIDKAVESILEPKIKMALRTTGHLLLGVVRIYSRKAKYLLADCNEAFVKIKMAFRPGMVVDLPQDAHEANLHAITLPEVFHDFDSALPDFNDFDYDQQLSLNQSRIEEITMKEDYPVTSYGLQDEAFGAEDFDPLEIQRFSDRDQVTELDISGRRPDLNLPGDKSGTAAGATNSGASTSAAVMPMDIDAPIIDDFGDHLDENLFGNDIFDGGNDDDDDADFDELQAVAKEVNFETDVPAPQDHPNLRSPVSSTATAAAMDKNSALGSGSTLTKSDGGVDTMTTSGVTTLIHNEEESFALGPLDATVATGLEKRVKRKRRLIVDETKAISGEDMKSQLYDYTDTVTTLDLAPPTKKLMSFKENSSAEKMLIVSSFCNCSKHLMNILLANISQRVKRDEAIENTLEGMLQLDELATGQLPPPTPRPDEADRDLAASGGVPPQASPLGGDQGQAQQQQAAGATNLEPIPEESVASAIEKERGLDSMQEPRMSSPDGLLTAMMLDEQGMLPPTDAVDDYNNQPQGGLPSVSPEPGSPWAPALVEDPSSLMINSSQSPASPRKERRSRGPATPKAPIVNDDEQQATLLDEQESLESQEEKQWSTKTQQLCLSIKTKLKHNDYINFLDLCARKDNRKIAAQKFYTLLVLKKWRAVDVEQDEPFGDIRIMEGPRMYETLVATE